MTNSPHIVMVPDTGAVNAPLLAVSVGLLFIGLALFSAAFRRSWVAALLGVCSGTAIGLGLGLRMLTG